VSEYQYYEFLAVDRALNADQLDELHAVSTRARIAPTSFVSTYHWGDLRADPRTLVERYFDAFLYLANWGTRRLMIRLPARLLDIATAQQYCVTDSASAAVNGENVILELSRQDEDGYWDDEGGEAWLASIIPARAQLAAGDLRLLYLAWLLSAAAEELDDDEVEPPVPPNLATLPASLRSLADFLRLDEDLLAVAAAASQRQDTAQRPEAELVSWIEHLPPAEKNTLILRVAHGDDAHLRTELRREFHGHPAPSQAAGRRTVAELLGAAQARREERERLAEQQADQERARRERQAAIARDRHLDALGRDEQQAWQRVSALIDTKKTREYDTAVELLTDLRDLSQRQGHPDVFEQHLQHLRQQYPNRPGLLDRLDRAGLVVTTTA